MRIVIIGVVVAALAVAGITAGLIKRYLSGQRNGETAVAEVDTVGVINILVATRDLPAGTIIGENEFAWSKWPEDKTKKDFFGEGEGVLDGLKGKVIRRSIGTGEPLTRGRVFTPGEGSHMAGILRAGMRAVSIEVDAVSGVSGFVSAGDKVDVFLYQIREIRGSGQGGGRERRRYAEPVLMNVQVLAVDQTVSDLGGDATLSKTATLEVTPKQAEVIAVAREMGKLSLALHSLARPEKSLYVGNYTSDTELSRALGGLGEFRDASKPEAKKPVKRKPVVRAKRTTRRSRTVDVYRATEHETVVFSGKAP
jgi:pilus assembly protein CpaB